MLDLAVFRIRQVVDMEEFLYAFHAFRRQRYVLVFFVQDEITGFFLFLCLVTEHGIHHGIQLVNHLFVLTALHLLGQHVTDLIKFGRLPALTGNDQRGTCFIDQYGVDLIDDGIMQTAQYQLLFIDDHVVTKIVKTKLIIRNIGNIAIICGTAFIRLHII